MDIYAPLVSKLWLEVPEELDKRRAGFFLQQETKQRWWSPPRCARLCFRNPVQWVSITGETVTAFGPFDLARMVTYIPDRSPERGGTLVLDNGQFVFLELLHARQRAQFIGVGELISGGSAHPEVSAA